MLGLWALPKNLGLGLNFRPCSEGYFLSGRPQSVAHSFHQIVTITLTIAKIEMSLSIGIRFDISLLILPPLLQVSIVSSTGLLGLAQDGLDPAEYFRLKRQQGNKKQKTQTWRGLQLQYRRIYSYLYFKTKMGVADVIFEPHPPNFENL